MTKGSYFFPLTSKANERSFRVFIKDVKENAKHKHDDKELYYVPIFLAFFFCLLIF